MTDESGLSLPHDVTKRFYELESVLRGVALHKRRLVRFPRRRGAFTGQRALTVGGGSFEWDGERWVLRLT